MKGQMFIIAAMFIVVGMIMIKNLVSPTLDETKRYVETITFDRTIKNIGNEYKYLTNVVLKKPYPSIFANYYFTEFSSFLKDDNNGFSVMYTFIYVNLSSISYRVTIGNYLDDDINITISAVNSNPSSYNSIIKDRTNQTFDFTITGLSVNITLNYTSNNARTIEKIPVILRSGAVLFYDIRLLKNNMYFQTKEIYNRTGV